MFSEIQLNKILLGLQKGSIPIKYSYVTDKGAQAWSVSEDRKKICNGGINYDMNLLLDTIDLYISELNCDNEITIFDFGAGVGNTIVPVIEYLLEKGYLIHYHAFDISENIIKLLKQNFQDNNTKVNLDYTIIDFEDKDLLEAVFDAKKKYDTSSVLGLFLGNTVGNFTSIERVLSNIMNALELSDKLVIGIERVDLENEKWLNGMLEGYRTDTSNDHDFATLEYLGFKRNDGVFETLFNKTSLSVETFYVFQTDISIDIAGRKFSFKQGEKIKVFHSKKLNEEEFSKVLVGLDLRICNLRTSKDNLYLQTLVENKKIY